MQKINTITAFNYNINVAKKQLPFSNSFTMLQSKVIADSKRLLINAIVQCTDDSYEAGRHYAVVYTLKGKLVSCWTLD
jgi:hypothetical protein